MLLTIRRIVKTGFVNFWRNGFVSVSSIVVMTITLFVIGALIFLNAMLDTALIFIKDKVDINAYFVMEASEESILAVKQALEGLPEVSSVTYTSREEAVQRFRERHQDDQLELQGLDELGKNPLLASLSIKATDPSKYERISSFLSSEQSMARVDGNSLVTELSFNEYDKKAVIERLQQVIVGIETFGLVLSSVLITISIIIVFNTIRMAIYISREEISVMRLVGATDMFIRGPFVFEGVMYGMISAVITLVTFYPLTLWLGPPTQRFFDGKINLFSYYTEHFGPIFLTIMATGMLLGAVSSFLAVKKYLRV